MKKQNKIAVMVAGMAKAMAKKGSNSASVWGAHQPKEPQKTAK